MADQKVDLWVAQTDCSLGSESAGWMAAESADKSVGSMVLWKAVPLAAVRVGMKADWMDGYSVPQWEGLMETKWGN